MTVNLTPAGIKRSFSWLCKSRRRTIVVLGAALSLGSLGVVLASHVPGPSPPTTRDVGTNSPPSRRKTTLPVEVVRPLKGGLPRKMVQTGTLEAFETADLVSRVSGYLNEIHVDIGDRVAKGQVLAEIDAPERIKDVERQKAVLQQAKNRELQAQARVNAVQAERAAAKGTVRQAEADVLCKLAERSFRQKERDRYRTLVSKEAIEERLFDEKQHLWEAAKAKEEYARASLAISEGELLALDTRIEQAKADLLVAKADVRVASADLDRAKLMAEYLKIVAPFSGIITERNCDSGTFVHTASNGKGRPLFRLARTDHMRIVIDVANPNVPFVRPGIPAMVAIDSLGGEIYTGTISRISHQQDPRTRTMRAEIDLPNPNDKLTSGMYGAVTLLTPSPSDAVTIPSDCFVGRASNGRARLMVVEDGRCQLRTVGLGHRHNERVEVLWNLAPSEFVVLSKSGRPGRELQDGAAINVVSVHQMPPIASDGLELHPTLQASR